MGWFDDIFAKKQEEAQAVQAAQAPADTAEASAGALAGGEAALAREHINRAAHEVLKLNGVPKDWVRFEILTLSDAAKAYFQLQVTIKHWDAYLLLHSWAFEQAVLARIRERHAPVAQALRAVLWRVSPDAACPYTSMPPSVAWTPEAIAQRANNLALFRAQKPREEVPANWVAEHQQHDEAFMPTLQVQTREEADAELQRVLQASQSQGR